MVEGPGAPAPVLIISFDDQETAEINWDLLKLCQRWQLKARYQSASGRLYLNAAGHLTFINTLQTWSDGAVEAAMVLPVYQAWWDIPRRDDLEFFMGHCRHNGLFILLPAINKRILTCLRPIVATLYQR